MTGYLLDANVLIAATVAEHEHHDRVTSWIAGIGAFATCPVVEGALTRFLLRMGESAATAMAVLSGVQSHPGSEFWPDSLSYADVDLTTIHGHRQVTDTYLAALAQEHGAQLATLDTALARRHPDHCLLVPAGS